MNSHTVKRIITPILAVVLLLLAIAWLAGAFKDKIVPARLPMPTQSYTSPYTVELQQMDDLEAFPAALQARDATLVSSRILARIETINVRAGQMISKGDVLITLNSTDLDARVSQAKAQVSAVKARAEEAARNFQRIQELQKQGLVSKSELDNASANTRQSNAQLLGARQALEEAQSGLAFATINSPISGRVVDRLAEPGDMATPGQTLLSLYNPSSLQVVANIRESIALKLTVGDKVQVKIDSLQQTVEGVVGEIVPAADANARSFEVKTDIEFNPALLPGMFARVLVTTGKVDRMLINKDYLRHFGQMEVVWVANEEQLTRRFVRTGRQLGDQVEVLSGLQAGEVIAQPPRTQK
ncbi:efflux RND transporter periplasmic adaptor subunit [Thalassotalea mangrovi]|uniref:Efflux RND transporter periplasmic adaptor subunit n=1 Tax=Thalassotalea mangrovi TaxID=2572245 RepID=A0A4U1B1V2_9GAMM|nr:efflux RND transporter periplasmic adaptor subunit [Thalassotalea mangrovi]TKB43461.1 efflux RND transporter periplasmic adaptor subunit [Thalassotalea mangrovi]